MRFAIGSVPQLEQFMSGINMGGLAQGGTDLRSKEKSTGIELQGKVGGAGLRAKGEAISGALLGDARAAAGRSQMMGQIFQTIGQVGGSAIGAGMFGGGTPVTSAHKGLGGFGPVASGKGYGGFLDATQGTTGMGPLASGDVYGSFLSRR
jgi:hypothetical protein